MVNNVKIKFRKKTIDETKTSNIKFNSKEGRTKK